MYTLMLDVWPLALDAAAAQQQQQVGGVGGHTVNTVSQQLAGMAPQLSGSSSSQQALPAAAAAAAAGFGHQVVVPTVLQWAQACVTESQQERYIWCSAVLALLDCLADKEAVRLPQLTAAVSLEVLVTRVLPAAAVVDQDLLVGLQEHVQQRLWQQQQQQGRVRVVWLVWQRLQQPLLALLPSHQPASSSSGGSSSRRCWLERVSRQRSSSSSSKGPLQQLVQTLVAMQQVLAAAGQQQQQQGLRLLMRWQSCPPFRACTLGPSCLH
jgi:hypothetical protein